MSAAEAFWGLFVLLSVVILSVDCRFVGTLGALCLAFCRDFVVVWSGGLLSVGSLGIGCSEEVLVGPLGKQLGQKGYITMRFPAGPPRQY
jgi:hypothetical protein